MILNFSLDLCRFSIELRYSLQSQIAMTATVATGYDSATL